MTKADLCPQVVNGMKRLQFAEISAPELLGQVQATKALGSVQKKTVDLKCVTYIM